jgi:hypothetical protein
VRQLAAAVVVFVLAVPAAAGDLPAPAIGYTAEIPILNTLDALTGVAADGEGNLWLTGITRTDSLPVTDDAIDKTFVGAEGFVVKLDPEGEIVYATYLGGRTEFDVPGSIAVDRDGNVYIAGATMSDDFPVTRNAFQISIANPGLPFFDAFLTKLDSTGALQYSTYFGGSGSDHFAFDNSGQPAASVAVAEDGSVYLAGTTLSDDLPVRNAYQPGRSGPFGNDTFLAKFSADFLLEYMTYFGGGNNEYGLRVAVDGNANAYLLGCTFRTLGAVWSLPVTKGAFQTDPETDTPNFVAKFDAAGALAYATFLAPTSGQDSFQCDFWGDLAADAEGNAYVVGQTGSASFPTTPGAFQRQNAGFTDVFLSKLDPTGSSLIYSTYFGGASAERAAGRNAGVRVAVSAEGNAYVAAISDSTDLPLLDPFYEGRSAGFVTKFTPDGSGLVYSSYAPLGAGPIALGPGAVFVAGNDLDGQGTLALQIHEGGAPSCPGDCDGNGTVAIDELMTGVEISLGHEELSTCPGIDQDEDGRVVVSELVRGIVSAVEGCG